MLVAKEDNLNCKAPHQNSYTDYAVAALNACDDTTAAHMRNCMYRFALSQGISSAVDAAAKVIEEWESECQTGNVGVLAPGKAYAVLALHAMTTMPIFKDPINATAICMVSEDKFYIEMSQQLLQQITESWIVLSHGMVKQYNATGSGLAVENTLNLIEADKDTAGQMKELKTKIGILQTVGHACQANCVVSGADCFERKSSVASTNKQIMMEYKQCMANIVTHTLHHKTAGLQTTNMMGIGHSWFL